MSSEKRFCVDCKFFKETYSDGFPRFRCCRPIVCNVRGPINGSFNPYAERENSNLCGPSALYFQPKE